MCLDRLLHCPVFFGGGRGVWEKEEGIKEGRGWSLVASGKTFEYCCFLWLCGTIDVLNWVPMVGLCVERLCFIRE